MSVKITDPHLLSTTVLNLLCGNLILFLTFANQQGYLMMLPCFSLAAVLLLSWTFRRIKPETPGWVLWLLGTFCSFAIPFCGGIIFGLYMGAAHAGSFGSGFMLGLVIGMIAVMYGSIMCALFALGNTKALFTQRRRLEAPDAALLEQLE